MELNQSRTNQAEPNPEHQGEVHHTTHTSNLQLLMVTPNAFDSGSQAIPEKNGADIALENSTTAPKKNIHAGSQKKKPTSQPRRRKAKVLPNYVFDLPEQFQEWLDAPPKRSLRLNPEQQIWFWKATGPDCFNNMNWDRCSQEFFKTYGVKWEGSRLLLEWYRVERKMRIAARVNAENEIIREGKLRRAKNAKAATEALNITQTPETLSTTMKPRNHIGQDDQKRAGVMDDCEDLVGSYPVGALELVSSTENTLPNPPTRTVVSQEKNHDMSMAPALLRHKYPQMMAADEPIAGSARRNLNISGQQVVPANSPSRINKTYMQIGYPMREDAQRHSNILPRFHSRPPAKPSKLQIQMEKYRTDLNATSGLTIEQPGPVVVEDHIASIHKQVVNRYLEIAAPINNSVVQYRPIKCPITTYPLPITAPQNKPLRVYTYSAAMGRVYIDAEMWFGPPVVFENRSLPYATTYTEGLKEILHALAFTPVQRNIVIISDSREAIHEITASKMWLYQMIALEDRMDGIGALLYRIFRLICEREETGSSTTFEWIRGLRGR